MKISPSERINIASLRLANLRAGAGEYKPDQRLREIDRMHTVIQRAFADHPCAAVAQ